MAGAGNYQNEIVRLNSEIDTLKQQLLQQQMQSQNYEQSMLQAHKSTANQPSARELNPILKQLRKKNLSLRDKQNLLYPELYPSMPDDIYYQWIAPTRVALKRDKQWYWTISLVLMILIVIAILAREKIWIAVILSFFFALFVQASLPPSNTIYRLTRQGIEIGEGDGLEIYGWSQLLEYSYYFKNNTEVLYVDTLLAVPQRIQILFTQEDRKNINMIMEAHLPYKVPPKKQGWLTRYVEGIYIPLQDFKVLQQKIDQYYDDKYAEIIHQLKQEGKVPQDTTVETIRNAESMRTMKLIDEIERQQEDEAKRILGI